MKYAYKDKKTYKLQHKLKLLLTILLAVLISTTGYIISKNAFSTLTDNGLIFIEENSRGYTITITASNIPLSGVELYDGSDNLIGTTNSLGVIDYSDANLPVLDYLIIDNNTITLTQENPNNYTFSYTMPLVGEAYAVLENDGDFVFFRSTSSYTNDTTGTFTDINNNSYTGRVFSGFESLSGEGRNNSLWKDYASSIQTVTVASGQEISPIDISFWFYNCTNVKIIDFSGINSTNITKMVATFWKCTSLEILDIHTLSTCANMKGMLC